MTSAHKPVLFFDFDNTLTEGDLLDALIEEFSPNERWRKWEAEWVAGRLPARDCLRLQLENMRVSRDALLERAARVGFDPWFAHIVGYARARQIPVIILSDSFLPIIRHVLERNGILDVPVIANQLEFVGDRLRPSFPYFDAAFPHSANAKARHIEPYRGQFIVYAGDGRSDLDPALLADLVFAKDGLARELRDRALPFRPFATLQPVLDFLDAMDLRPALTAAH